MRPRAPVKAAMVRRANVMVVTEEKEPRRPARAGTLHFPELLAQVREGMEGMLLLLEQWEGSAGRARLINRKVEMVARAEMQNQPLVRVATRQKKGLTEQLKMRLAEMVEEVVMDADLAKV